MTDELEYLKQRIPLLDYLQQRNWTARRVGAHLEFVGLCPLHPDTRPSFYVMSMLPRICSTVTVAAVAAT